MNKEEIQRVAEEFSKVRDYLNPIIQKTFKKICEAQDRGFGGVIWNIVGEEIFVSWTDKFTEIEFGSYVPLHIILDEKLRKNFLQNEISFIKERQKEKDEKEYRRLKNKLGY